MEFLKESAANALLWTGVLALGITLWAKDYSLAAFFIAVIAFNVLMALALRLLAPKAFEKAFPQAGGVPGTVGFNITPLSYPKVLDRELRDFAPEFIRFDIKQNGARVFSANLARDAIRQLRDTLATALEVKESVAQQFAPQTAQASGKKARDKK